MSVKDEKFKTSSSDDIIKFDIFIENITSKEHLWILKFFKEKFKKKKREREISQKGSKEKRCKELKSRDTA